MGDVKITLDEALKKIVDLQDQEKSRKGFIMTVRHIHNLKVIYKLYEPSPVKSYRDAYQEYLAIRNQDE